MCASRERSHSRAARAGASQLDLAETFRDLAADQRKLRNYPQAEAAADEAVRLVSEWYEPLHADVTKSLVLATEIYEEQNKYTEAVRLRRQDYEYWTSQPEENRILATACDNLAWALRHDNRHVEALPLLHKSLDIQHRLGTTELLHAWTYRELAFNHRRLEEFQQAEAN